MLALLYGFYFNPLTGDYDKISEITKPDTASKIPIGIFNNNSMSEISAIVFSCTVTLGKLTSLAKSQGASVFNSVINIRHDQDEPHYKIQDVSQESPEELSDGLFVFHNPYAKNKLSKEFFNDTNAIQITIVGRNLQFEGNNLPIVSRLNTLIVDSIKPIVFNEIFHRFNPAYISSIFKVLEIDLQTTPPEITLLNEENNLACIVDMTTNDVLILHESNIVENDQVSALIKSSLNEIREVKAFQLIHIEKIRINDNKPHT